MMAGVKSASCSNIGLFASGLPRSGNNPRKGRGAGGRTSGFGEIEVLWRMHNGETGKRARRDGIEGLAPHGRGTRSFLIV